MIRKTYCPRCRVERLLTTEGELCDPCKRSVSGTPDCLRYLSYARHAESRRKVWKQHTVQNGYGSGYEQANAAARRDGYLRLAREALQLVWA